MQRFKNILCVVNTDRNDTSALEHAAKLAANNQAYLTVIEVIDEIPPNTKLFDRTLSPVDVQKKIVAEHQKKLEEMVSSSSKKIKIESKVLTGISFLEIIHEVLRNGHDLVFKTAESSGLLDRVFGSDDMHLLRKCPCPVWLVKPNSPKSYQTILAPVDVDDFYPPEELTTRHLLNVQVLEMAGSLAILESADLHVVHVGDAIGENVINMVFHDTPEDRVVAYTESVRQQYEDNMDKLMHELTSYIGQDAMNYIHPQRHLLKGYPRKEIPLFAEKIKADLVIMGTVARTGIPGLFMGNTAESILYQLDCSVLAVKPPGFVTPVTLDQ
jgi:nucleotide-binding universal stress UspA family protein